MKNDSELHHGSNPQYRMVQPGSLLSLDGRPMEAGWATHQIKRYDPSLIRAPKLRIKQWDYYCIVSEFAALALTISDNGYVGLDAVSIMDFEQKTQHTATRLTPFPLGKRGLPTSSDAGVIRAQGKGYELTFRTEGTKRHLYGHVYDFGGQGRPLLFDVILTQPSGDSLVIATPFAGKPHCFYYNQKINCMPADGRCIFGEQEYVFSPSSSFGVLDWGRGVWPYRSTRYWASASGVVMGRRFGFNLGYGFGDTSAATENALFCDGIAHKLANVVFEIPGSPGREDYLQPWHIHDDQGRLDLQFAPILDRASKTSALIIFTRQHQVFGRYSGTAKLDDGSVLILRELTGFAEKVKNRY